MQAGLCGEADLCWPLLGFGVARAPAPDVRSGPPGRRSLGPACASPSMAPLVGYAGFGGTGDPSREALGGCLGQRRRFRSGGASAAERHPESRRLAGKHLSSRRPDPQLAMTGGVGEVLIRGEKRQLMADAELGEKGVDCSDLHSALATFCTECGGVYVILSIGLHQRQRGKTINDLPACLGTGKSLKQFLENEACRHDSLFTEQSLLELANLWLHSNNVSPQCQRPNTCVHQKHHGRSITNGAFGRPCSRKLDPIRACPSDPRRGAVPAGQ